MPGPPRRNPAHRMCPGREPGRGLASAPSGSPPAVAPAVREDDRQPLGGRLAAQLGGRGAQREREVRPALAAQREQLVDDRLGRAGPRSGAWSTSASAANAITLVEARSVRVSTTAAAAIAASPTAWPFIEPLWSISRHSGALAARSSGGRSARRRASAAPCATSRVRSRSRSPSPPARLGVSRR